ncbi:fimbrial protein [Pseudomonas koreensis]|uniref:fimbrial protein n=1 Tax=Pseudomonas koreensis TaxID=198620 RepID=UPI002FCC9BBC
MATEKPLRYAMRALYIALYVALVVFGTTVHPVMAASHSTINVIVILTAPPCEINHNKLIEVNFGNDVLTTLVDGNYKKMPVPYTVQCPTGATSAMSIRIEGTGAAFDPDVLMSNITDFGIAISSNGTSLPINSSKNFTYPNWPQLEAAPVKRRGATLSGGVFSAGAVMKVEYR